MTRTQADPRSRTGRSTLTARRLLVGTITLLLVTVSLYVGTGCLPVDGGAHEPSVVPTAAVVGGGVRDDPRLRDSKVDPLDSAHPAIAGLRPPLRAALQEAARDARAQGVELWVTSGRRSAAYQQELLDQAVQRYGSLGEARRFVETPEGSSHVTGDAVDVGPTDAADWMIRNGADYGLCQTYANEMWHFELATDPGGSCPRPLQDAAG